jgi:hypothetical protein
MNEEDKIIRKISIFLIIQKRWFEVSAAWLLRKVFWVVASCGWVICSRSSEEIYCGHPQGYESNHGLVILEMKAVRFFETSGSNNPTTQRTDPKRTLIQHEKRFATNKIFQRIVSAILTISFTAVFFLSSALVSQPTMLLAVIIVDFLTCKWTLWRTQCLLSLSICLPPPPPHPSLAHTHTRAHAYTHTSSGQISGKFSFAVGY